jgi:hypothetical protein
MRKFLMVKFVGLLLIGHCSGQSLPTKNLAQAIARAEGFGVVGTIPTRLHNPGDLRALSPHTYPGQIGVDSKRYAIFRNDRAGWAALYHQLDKIMAGASRFYSPQITFQQFSRAYAEVNGVWLRNVCNILKVTPAETFEQYFARSRQVLVTVLPDPQPIFDLNFFTEGAL